MAEDDRRLLDPRYVTWEQFNRALDDIERRLGRMSDEQELWQGRMTSALASREKRIDDLEKRVYSLSNRVIGAVAVVGLVASPLITWILAKIH